MTWRYLILCAVLCVPMATVESKAPLTCGTCKEAGLDENFQHNLCYDTVGRYSALRQRMFELSSVRKFDAISRILVEAYKDVHQCQTDVCAYTLLFQEKLPFNFASITETEKMEILCQTSQHPFCRDYFNGNKRDTSSDVKNIMPLVAGHRPECLQSMIDYHIREVLEHTHFTPAQIHSTNPTVHVTDKATVTDATSSATDAVTSSTVTAKVTDAVTSATPTVKVTDAVTSATPTAKVTDAVTSATPTAKVTDAVTSDTPTAKVTDAVTSATPTASETTTIAKISTTAKPQPLICATCTDILSCTFKPTETTCGPGELCMTTVTDTLSSSRNVVKGCESVTWCSKNWWSQTSDVSTCLDVDSTVHDFDQTCMYCCDRDRCNGGKTLVPTNLYKPKD
ncbi:uncharacterized protein [Haliotis asinina]|uniref:uncharacterized protein n=1 Tax=Haliotis asinina TaxID=109174 RepID=UPI003531F2DD